MCGLIGIAVRAGSGFTNQEVDACEELLFLDTLRGPDSTGVCAVFNDASVRVAKKSTWAPNFICSKAFTELKTKILYQGKIFMGHNRKATVGNINSLNAHPFIVQNELVLMHNGSLYTHKHLGDTEVDSEAIAQYIHDKWVDDATPEEKAEVLAHIGGAWALTWYDLRTEKLYIVRNNQRPLSYLWNAGTLIWASESEMLEIAAKRNSLGLSVNIKPLPAYTLLTFDGQELQEVALPQAPFFPKPSPVPHTPTTPSKPGWKATPTGESEEYDETLSKNKFKRFLKSVVGKTFRVSVEDFVDVHGKNQWYGEHLGWKFKHEMIGYASDEVMLEVLSNYNFGNGTILSGIWDKTTGSATFHVKLEAPVAIEICH